MGKEQAPQSNLELEKRKTFERMAVSGILAIATTTASCANQIFIVPTIIFYAESLRNFRKYDKLEEQISFPEKVLSLPTLPLRADAGENQRIEGKKGKVHHRIVKEEVLPRSKIIIYSLSTSGPEKKRQEFVKQIIERLGEPFNTEQQFPNDPNFYTFWEAKKVEERLRKISP